MSVIDADAHVIETERTWSFMREEDRRFAPELLVSNRNGVEFWRIDDRVFPNSNLGLNVPEESRDLTDVRSRVAHMDSLGIDTQVLYPSLFLRPLTARADVDLALCRGYNRWLADIWKQGNGRLRWVVLPPLRFTGCSNDSSPALQCPCSGSIIRINSCQCIGVGTNRFRNSCISG
jgi:predicted TIM-barrel fold metal-dependent hydrolase